MASDRRELIKLAEQSGFVEIRSSKHLIMRKDSVTLTIPHSNSIKRIIKLKIIRQIQNSNKKENAA